MNEAHTIIWDWNGTLLNDVDICIRSMNLMLSKRHLPLLDLIRYREVFTFPVQEYYLKIGFDFRKESWDVAAHEFIHIYLDELPKAGLAPGALDALLAFRNKGFRQAIISAMQHDALLASVDALGISDHLDYIGGIGDHYGEGKTENARRFFREFDLQPENATLLGDSLHDAEVAKELGIHCILVAAGHQSAERLRSSGFRVAGSLTEIIDFF